MENKLVIFDGNSIAYRAFFGLPLLKNKNGEYTNAIFGFLNMMLKCITEIKPTHIIVVFDYPLKENFRTKMYADYKSTRKPMPEELAEQMPKLKELINSLGINVFQEKGVEADDVIGTLAKRFNEQTIIITGDRDALQLIDNSTSVLLTKRGLTDTKLLTVDNFFDEYGFDPINIIDLKSIMGDASDNIPGVTGIGEKGASDLIKRYKTLENVYEHIGEVSTRNQRLLTEQKEIAILSKNLATINTNVEIRKTDFGEFKLVLPFNNEAKKLFKKYEFNSLLKNKNLFGDGSIDLIETDVQISNDNVEVTLKNYKTNIIEKLSELQEFVNKFNSKAISIILEDEDILFAINNKEQYIVVIKKSLVDEGLSYADAVKILSPILANKNIKKECFDYKQIKHWLKLFGVNFCGIENDAKIARWLTSSNAKDENIKNLFLYCGELNVTACGLFNVCNTLTTELHNTGLFKLYKDVELPLIDILFEMEENGIKLSGEVRKGLKAHYEQVTQDLQREIYMLAGLTFNLQSPKQVGDVLYNKLGLGEEKWGTSIQVLKQLEPMHVIVSRIIEYRKYNKLLSTYIIPFEQAENNKDNLIHTTFNQTGTITGRLSSANPNMQNIPSRTGEGREVRKMFVSRFEGGELVSADYSQIELRLLAHYSADKTISNSFINNEDIHASTASQIFGVALNEVTKTQRNQAKAVNFGIIYGISAFGLSDQIGVTPAEAKVIIDNYYKHFGSVGDYMNNIVAAARANNGAVETLFGRKRVINELFDKNKNLQKFGERAARNFPFQGTASDIIKIAMISISNKLKEGNFKSKLCLQIHDELIFDCVKEEIEAIKELAKTEMENVIKLNVPLIANVGSGKSLFDI